MNQEMASLINSLMDAKPVRFRVSTTRQNWPEASPMVEEMLEAIRLLYQALGGQDVILIFKDKDDRQIANPVDGGTIEIHPYDDPPRC